MKEIRLYPPHLDSPLVTDKLDFYRLYPAFAKKRYKWIPISAWNDLSLGFVGGVNVMAWIESKIKLLYFGRRLEASHHYYRTIKLATRSAELQANVLSKGFNHQVAMEIAQRRFALESDRDLNAATISKMQVILFKHDLDVASRQGEKEFDHPEWTSLKFGDDLVLIQDFPGTPLVITYNMFLCVLDKIEACYNFLLYVVLASCSPIYRLSHFKEFSKDLYRFLDNLYMDHGNHAISFFKKLEPLMRARVLELDTQDRWNQNAWDMTMRDLIEDYPEFLAAGINLRKIVDNLVDTDPTHSRTILLEQYGQEKFHFFPLVKTEEGMTKMRCYGTSTQSWDNQFARMIDAEFKKQYILAYFCKHVSLPPIYDNPAHHHSIKTMINNGRPPLPYELSQIPLESWARITFKPHQIFNTYPEPLDLLDDKGMTPSVSNIYPLYVVDALRAKKLPTARVFYNSRLIVEVLKRDDIDIQSYFNTVHDLGHIPLEWSWIQLMAKERELKLEPRVFSILTLEVRMMAATLERNLSEKVLSLFPQQSMTSSGAEVTTKIDTMSSLSLDSTERWIYFHLDLDQWNYTFRAPNQAPILATLDEIFGIPYYKNALRPFLDGRFVSANKYNPPVSLTPPFGWQHHAGGNQGICQKLWTLITILVLFISMDEFGLDYRLIGAGDNQVLAIKCTQSINIVQTVQNIKECIRVHFAKIGLTLKTDETWASSTLLSYQRRYYYKGVTVPTGLKHAMRAFASQGDLSYGLSTTISTSMAGGSALVEMTSDPYCGIIFSYMMALIMILSNPVWNGFQQWSDDMLIMLTLGCTEYGYLPFQSLENMLYAGHKDSLTEFLALVSKLWQNGQIEKASLVGIMSYFPARTNTQSLLSLIMNPHMINIQKTRSPEMYIKDAVTKYLRNPINVRNKRLRSYFNFLSENDLGLMASQLMSIDPINLNLLHTLLKHSIVGQIQSTLNRFNRITSIIKCTGINRQSKEHSDLHSVVDRMDQALVKDLTKRIKSKHQISANFYHQLLGCYYSSYLDYCMAHNLEFECTFSLRLYLLAHSFNLTNHLISGPFCPAPFEQLELIPLGVTTNLSDTIMISPASSMPRDRELLEITRGPFPLYVGAKTKNTVKCVKLTSLDNVEAGAAVRELIKSYTWLEKDNASPELLTMIAHQIEARLQGMGKVLQQTTKGIKGGTFEHRYAAEGEVMGVYSHSSTTISTWYRLSTNHASDFHNQDDDRMIFYQHLYQYLYSSLRFAIPFHVTRYVKIHTNHCGIMITKKSFHVNSAFSFPVPGNLGMISFSKDQIEQIRHELEYAYTIDNHLLSTGLSRTNLLSAAIGLILAKSVKSYQLGSHEKSISALVPRRPQVEFNANVVRSCSLQTILSSIVIQFAATGVITRSTDPKTFLGRLIYLSTRNLTLLDVQVYRDWLEVLIVSGKVQELVTYTGMPIYGGGSGLHLPLLKIFLQGLIKTARAILDRKVTPILIIQASHSLSTVAIYLRQLRRWIKPTHESIIASLKEYSPQYNQVLEKISDNIKLVLCTDVDKLVGIARGMTPIPQDPIPVPANLSENSLRPISWIGTRLPPWVVVKLARNKNTGQHPMYSERLTGRNENNIEWNRFLIQSLKSEPSISGAHYKLIEVLHYSNIDIVDYRTCICLAEGAGSYLSALAHLAPYSDLYYNSKLVAEDLSHSQAGIFTPPELYCTCSVINRLTVLSNHSPYSGDLGYPEEWKYLRGELNGKIKSNSILTFDMESHSTNYPDILDLLTEFVSWAKCTTVVIKSFSSKHKNRIAVLCLTLGQTYKHCTLLKPSYSNPRSSEFFIVGHQFDPTLSYPIDKSPKRSIRTFLDKIEQLGSSSDPTILTCFLHSQSSFMNCKKYIRLENMRIRGYSTVLEEVLDSEILFSQEILKREKASSLKFSRDEMSLLFGWTTGQTATTNDIISTYSSLACYFSCFSKFEPISMDSLTTESVLEIYHQLMLIEKVLSASLDEYYHVNRAGKIFVQFLLSYPVHYNLKPLGMWIYLNYLRLGRWWPKHLQIIPKKVPVFNFAPFDLQFKIDLKSLLFVLASHKISKELNKGLLMRFKQEPLPVRPSNDLAKLMEGLWVHLSINLVTNYASTTYLELYHLSSQQLSLPDPLPTTLMLGFGILTRDDVESLGHDGSKFLSEYSNRYMVMIIR